MRTATILICGAAAGLAACGPSGDSGAAANLAAAAPRPEKTPYCFFKDAETKSWKAATDKQGNVVVKGKAYRSDGRYKALLGDAKVTGATAVVRPTIVQNDTGFSMADNWWDMSFTIPGSAAVTSVEVRCGKKVVAALAVPRKG